MLRDFPDRFMIGSDNFMGEETEHLDTARRLVDAFPADIRQQIASESAKRVYRRAPR